MGDIPLGHDRGMVAVDIFRVKDGKVVEHWDVMQEESSAADTASGNAMFTKAE